MILKPGRRTIAVQANGFVSEERTVEVSAGQFDSLQFDLKQASQDTAPPSKAVSASQTPTEGLALEATLEAPEATTPVGAYVLFGTAGASAIAAAVVSVLASEEHKNLETLSIEGDPNAGDIAVALKGQWRDAESAMNTYQTLSYALYGAAAATAIGGLIWMLVDDPSASAQDTSMAPNLKLNPTQRGLNANLEWSF